MTKTQSGLIALSSIVLLTVYAVVKQAEDNNSKYKLEKLHLLSKSEKPQNTKSLTPTLVKHKTKIKYTKKDVECLARNIYFEARGEDTVGQFAIAHVTINRVLVNRKKWGNSICEVVYAKKQFSWTTKKKLRYAKLKGKTWESSKSIAIASLTQGIRVKDLEKALFYHASYVDPDWRDDRNRIKSIGTHIFYTRAKGDKTKL